MVHGGHAVRNRGIFPDLRCFEIVGITVKKGIPERQDALPDFIDLNKASV